MTKLEDTQSTCDQERDLSELGWLASNNQDGSWQVNIFNSWQFRKLTDQTEVTATPLEAVAHVCRKRRMVVVIPNDREWSIIEVGSAEFNPDSMKVEPGQSFADFVDEHTGK